MGANGWWYEKLPVAGDAMSSYTKTEVGYNLCITYCPGNFLYRVLCAAYFSILSLWESLLTSDFSISANE